MAKKELCRHDPKYKFMDFKLEQEHCRRCGLPLVLRETKPYFKHCNETGKKLTRFIMVCPKIEGFWHRFFSGFMFDSHTSGDYGQAVECHVVDKYRVEVV